MFYRNLFCTRACATLALLTYPGTKHNVNPVGKTLGSSFTPPFTAAVDLGGTKILAAITDRNHRVLGRAKVSTDVAGGLDAIMHQMADSIRKAARKSDLDLAAIVAVGACVPGPVDPATGIVGRAVNLGWEEPIPLAALLSRALNGIPVVLENDVNAGTYGELVAGAAVGMQDVIGVFVGTGIGGGIVLQGSLRRGPRFIAGEVGHTILQVDGPLCSCGNYGCAEALASRSALEKGIHTALRQGHSSVITELMAKRGEPRITSGMIRKAYKRQDALIVEQVHSMARYLGLLTASLANVIDPQMVVFGGGVVDKLKKSLLRPVRATAYENLMARETFRIEAAHLGDDAGAIGAAALARETLPSHV